MSSPKNVVVIGAGPAGYVCAIRLAQLGQKVTVVEKSELGGTCLNVGCIPSKAMIAAGALMERIRHASAMGITVDGTKLDLPKLVEWKEGVVKRMTGGITTLFKMHKIEHLKGEAKIVDKTTVKVGDKTLKCDELVIATGSVPIGIPGFEIDEKDVWSSTAALVPKELPKHLLVIRGGYVRLELGIL